MAKHHHLHMPQLAGNTISVLHSGKCNTSYIQIYDQQACWQLPHASSKANSAAISTHKSALTQFAKPQTTTQSATTLRLHRHFNTVYRNLNLSHLKHIDPTERHRSAAIEQSTGAMILHESIQYQLSALELRQQTIYSEVKAQRSVEQRYNCQRFSRMHMGNKIR